MIKAFPKIFTIGTDYIRDIFQDEVEITEKIDGSQFAFGKLNGELYMRSKGTVQYAQAPDKMFNLACDYVSSIQDKLPEDIIFYCEYLNKPKHNVLAYGRVPKNNLIMFGASSSKDSFIPKFQQYAELLDIETVPVIYRGKINSAEELLALLDRESVLGTAKIEGVVCKNYLKPFLLGGQPIPLMAGKFVSEAFKEVHRSSWGKEHSGAGRWETFVSSFKTEARWQKAVQRLKESGQLTNEPKDIGSLMKEVNCDIEAEEKENVKEFLWKEHKREILSSATRGLPEWYKEQLLKNSFQPGEANVEEVLAS